MTFNAAIPLNSNSPAIFPAQSQTNFGRLQTLLGANHQFNLTASANDGFHTLINLIPQAPSGPLPGVGRDYIKSSAGRLHKFYMDETGAEYQITPTMPIRASVNFSGEGSTSIRSGFNVASVTYVGTGRYRVNFITAMPNNNYMVQATGMRSGSGNVCVGCIESDNTYGASVTTTYVDINFFGSSDSLRDVLMGSVTIFSSS